MHTKSWSSSSFISRDAYMHACMHAYDFILNHPITRPRHSQTQSENIISLFLCSFVWTRWTKKVYYLLLTALLVAAVVVVLKKTENRDFRPLIFRQPKMLST